MSFPPSAHCCNAVRRRLRPQIRPQYDSVWIPDILLSSAFARYAATFRPGARYGSSVPGPMEHRKRMAKRHMGELHLGQSHSAAPLWELANLVDLTQWKWKPPSLFHANSRQANTCEEVSLPPPDLSTRPPFLDPTLLSHDAVLPGVAELSGVAEPDLEPEPVLCGADTVSDIIDSCVEMIYRDTLCSSTVFPSYYKFCESWRQSLGVGEFRSAIICQLLSGLTRRIMDLNIPNLRKGRHVTTNATFVLLFLNKTIDGLHKRDQAGFEPVDSLVWNTLLLQISSVRTVNTSYLFGMALARMPQQHTSAAIPGISENLDVHLRVLGQPMRVTDRNNHATILAKALRVLSHTESRCTMDAVCRRLLLQSTDLPVEEFVRSRFAFLQCLARLPAADLQYIAQKCLDLERSPDRIPLTDREVCVLFVLWAHKDCPLANRTAVSSSIKSRKATVFRDLGIVLRRTGQLHRIRPLCTFLELLGRQDHIQILAKAVSKAADLGDLASMALRMSKPLSAIRILIYEEEARRHRGCKDVWDTDFGFAALESLIWTHNFDAQRLWTTLGMSSKKGGDGQGRTRQPKAITPKRTTQVAAIGVVLGLSPYLTQQRAFYLMTHCYRYLRKHNAKLPPTFLRALVRNITRHLVNGEPGITSRMRYVLHIIKEETGPEEAQRIALALHRWRTVNFEATRNALEASG